MSTESVQKQPDACMQKKMPSSWPSTNCPQRSLHLADAAHATRNTSWAKSSSEYLWITYLRYGPRFVVAVFHIIQHIIQTFLFSQQNLTGHLYLSSDQ